MTCGKDKPYYEYYINETPCMDGAHFIAMETAFVREALAHYLEDRHSENNELPTVQGRYDESGGDPIDWYITDDEGDTWTHYVENFTVSSTVEACDGDCVWCQCGEEDLGGPDEFRGRTCEDQEDAS